MLWFYHKYIQPWFYPIISKFWKKEPIEPGSAAAAAAAAASCRGEKVGGVHKINRMLTTPGILLTQFSHCAVR